MEPSVRPSRRWWPHAAQAAVLAVAAGLRLWRIELAEWVRAHGRPVDASVWGGTLSSAGRGSRRQLYDLKPEAGLAPASEKGRT